MARTAFGTRATWRALAYTAAAVLAVGACSSDDDSASTTATEPPATAADSTTPPETDAATPTAPDTTAAPDTAPDTTPGSTDAATTSSPATAEVDADELLWLLEELETAVEDGDEETAARLGGPGAEARAWYRKLGALFAGNYPASVAPEVTGELTIVDDDGEEIRTEGEYRIEFPDDDVLVNADPVFVRSDDGFVLSSATSVSATGKDDDTFTVRGAGGEPVSGDGGLELTPRATVIEKTSEFVFADFVFSTDDPGDRNPLSSVWVDAAGHERVSALQAAVDERTGDTVYLAAFDSMPLDQSIGDGLGTVTLWFDDGESVTSELQPAEVPDDQLAKLDPAPEEASGADEAADTRALRDGIHAYGAATALCSVLPDQCEPIGPFGPKVLGALEAQATFGLDENIRVRFPPRAVFYRVDDVRIHPTGLQAVVETCNHDGAIQVDIGNDPVDAADDQVVNDEEASATVLFVFDRVDGEWMLDEYATTRIHDDPDECTEASSDTFIPVDEPSVEAPTGVDASGQVEFAQTLVQFVQNTVRRLRRAGDRSEGSRRRGDDHVSVADGRRVGDRGDAGGALAAQQPPRRQELRLCRQPLGRDRGGQGLGRRMPRRRRPRVPVADDDCDRPGAGDVHRRRSVRDGRADTLSACCPR